jgi:hypothetical protein
MANIFPKATNLIVIKAMFALSVIGGLATVAVWYYFTPKYSRVGYQPVQPVAFDHSLHAGQLGIDCRFCHSYVEVSGQSNYPATQVCMSCHTQIQANNPKLQPVRDSWATGQSIAWTKVHDLPDFVYFNHEIHVNKGIGCASCHGRVDEMPLMYAQNTLQMEWCLDCHRNPSKNIRPTSEIYNMAWQKPAEDHPVWCTAIDSKNGVPTAESVSCTVQDPANAGPEMASLALPAGAAARGLAGDVAANAVPAAPAYVKFTSQDELGHFLVDHYKIRTPKDLTSCEVCHR